MMFIFLISIFSFLLSAFEVRANTRLGLHVTKDELAIWQTRAVSGPYRTAGDVSTNSPGDWTRITGRVSAFNSNPTAQMWVASVGMADITGGNGPGHHDGNDAMFSAFATLVMPGTYNQAANVRTLILAQMAQTATQWNNRTKWPLSIGDNAGGLANYLTRLAYAYDYIRIASPGTFSAGEKTTVETWFSDAANYFAEVSDTSNRAAYPNRNTEFNSTVDVGSTYTTDNTGSNPGSAPNITHYDCTLSARGHLVGPWHQIYNNRATEQVRMAAVGAHLNGSLSKDAQTKRWVKMWFKEFLTYGTFADNMTADYYRWIDNSNTPTNGWQYTGQVHGAMATVADLFARNGDTSLYDWSTSGGKVWSSNPSGYNGNTNGGPKSLLKVLQRHAGFTNQRSTSVPNWVGSDDFPSYAGGPQCGANRLNYLIQPVDVPFGSTSRLDDTRYVHANLYYQDATIKGAYMRTATGAPVYSAAPPDQGNPWGGEWWTYPAILFMFGNLEAVVNPYVLGGERFVDNSTTATSTCVNGSATYNPATRSCGSGTSTVYVSGDPIKAALAAIPLMGGGDTLWIRSGTYSDGNPTMRNGSSSTSRFVMSGYLNEIPTLRPASAPIAYGGIYFAPGAQWATAKNLRILLNAPGLAGVGCRGVIWDGESGGGIVDGLVVENIEIDGTGNVCNGSGGMIWYTAAGMNQSCPNCKIINMHIHNVGLAADTAGNEGHGMRIVGQGVEVIGGSFHDIGDYCILFYAGEPQSAPPGYGPTNITIRNTTTYRCGSAGIAFLPGTTATHKIDIYNNVLYNNGAGIRANGPDGSSKIYSNTVYNSGNAIWLTGAASNTEVRNNRLIGGTPFSIDTGVIQTSNTTTGTVSSTFAFAANGDFRLCTAVGVPHVNCTGSAIDMNLPGPTVALGTLGSPWNTDIVGTSRPQGSGYATGAYEEGAGGSVTPTPLQFALKLACDGNVNDTSGNGNSGSLVAGATASVAGKYNQGCSFNGTTAHIQISDSNSLDMQGGFTVAAWVKATSAPPAGYQLVLAKENSPSTDGSYYLAASGSTGSCPSGSIFGGYLQGGASILACQAVPLDTNWTHLAVTYDAASPAEVLLYRGGLPVNNVPGGATLTPGTGHLFIGSGGTAAGTGNFNGMIDEVWIFKGKLPATSSFDSDCTTNASDPNSWSINRVMNCSINPVTPTPGAPTGVKVGGAGSVKIGGGGIVRMGQ